MPLEMITIRELLRDPQFKAYFTKPPTLPAHYQAEGVKPWKLLVMKKNESFWRSKRYATYAEAFAGMKKMLPTISDAAINSPALGFMPPVKTYRLKGKFDRKGQPILRTKVWTPQLEADMGQHYWCPHCRRPTIFRTVALGPRRNGTYMLPSSEAALRCFICGASERVVDLRHPENAQKWDPTRPKVYKND